MNNNTKIIPVILCGGSGTRLWPLSREGMPKQFLNLIGDFSLLQETIKRTQRVCGAGGRDFVNVTLGNSEKELTRQLRELGADYASHVLSEPSARDTAAAVAFAAHYVSHTFGPEALMWVLPADHHIRDENALKSALDKAVIAAQDNYLTTFGIEPSRPETGYGYIQYEEKTIIQGVQAVAQFVEKPNREIAQSYIDDGNFLWNSGMFLFKASTVLDNYLEHAQHISASVHRAMSHSKNRPNSEVYTNIPKTPFDKAIMEKSDRVAVVPCDPEWSDIGSWESLWDVNKKDKNGNVLEGDIAMYNSEGCFVHAEERLVTCAGLKNIVVVETADAIMIADKSASDDMKTLVTSLKKAKRREVSEPPKETRPWGMFKTLSQTQGYKIKEITVEPGGKLSLQMHHHRSEFWVVLEGEALITVDDTERLMKKEEMIFIPKKSKHRLENPGTGIVKIIEVQCGDYLGEDDIVRFDDIYGRAAA